jgi:hypothetical protein
METFKSSTNLKNDDYLCRLKLEQAGQCEWTLDPNISGKYTVVFKQPYKEPPLVLYNVVVKNGSFDVTHQLFDITEKAFVICIQNASLSEPVNGVIRWKSNGC